MHNHIHILKNTIYCGNNRFYIVRQEDCDIEWPMQGFDYEDYSEIIEIRYIKAKLPKWISIPKDARKLEIPNVQFFVKNKELYVLENDIEQTLLEYLLLSDQWDI